MPDYGANTELRSRSRGAATNGREAHLFRLVPGARKRITAQCYMLIEGPSLRYVVLKGSEAVCQEGLHLLRSGRSIIQLRRKLLDSGVLALAAGHLVFTRDYTFFSPSTAAGVILGRTANGYICWADMEGRLLDSFRPRPRCPNSR